MVSLTRNLVRALVVVRRGWIDGIRVRFKATVRHRRLEADAVDFLQMLECVELSVAAYREIEVQETSALMASSPFPLEKGIDLHIWCS